MKDTSKIGDGLMFRMNISGCMQFDAFSKLKFWNNERKITVFQREQSYLIKIMFPSEILEKIKWFGRITLSNLIKITENNFAINVERRNTRIQFIFLGNLLSEMLNIVCMLLKDVA